MSFRSGLACSTGAPFGVPFSFSICLCAPPRVFYPHRCPVGVPTTQVAYLCPGGKPSNPPETGQSCHLFMFGSNNNLHEMTSLDDLRTA